MGIVNAGSLPVYDDIPQDLLLLCENLLWDRDPLGTEKMLEYGQKLKSDGGKRTEVNEGWRQSNVDKRIEYALIKVRLSKVLSLVHLKGNDLCN